ncbi:MFS transporter [Chromatiales bacterium (ex Bugula neritina AB1)]|nr:MFS transporter [Chromatiales bacterium (ex Bugula neritina AB1)]
MTRSPALAPQQRLYAAFALHAMTMGSLFPRMPEIKQAMGVEEGVLGLALVGTPVGTMLALSFASPMIEKIGFRRLLLAAIPIAALFYALAVQTVAPLLFFLLLIPAGIAVGCVEIVINVEADRTEALLKRRVMNRAHSFWSFGFFLSSIMGASFAHFGISPQLHLGIMVPCIALMVVFFLGDFKPAPGRGGADAPASGFAHPTGPIILLVLVTLSAMLMEGAGIDWSAIYMDTIFASGAFVAGFAVAVVTLSQGITRYFADGFVDKYSPVAVGRALLLCMGAGILLILFPVSAVISLIGFAMLGIGTSVLFPLAMSAAAQRTDRPATVNVAALAQISFGAFLAGPPLLGLVAEHFGIQWVYGAGLPLVLLSLLLVKVLDGRD